MLRFEREGEPNQLAPGDVFVSTVDPLKEPPIITANTALSILAVDYPAEKEVGAIFVRNSVEPRAPDFYFNEKIDYLKDKVQPTFVKDCRAMKREYEEFKVKINAIVAKAQKKTEGWVMQDGTPWPGNGTRDHPGMIQVYLGSEGAVDIKGKELPHLVYVSGYQHHKKAGSMNALVRVAAVLINAPFMLNLDCDHYLNNSKAVREAMCFLMDP